MKVLILTEFSETIGFGHLSRTLALAERFYDFGCEIKYLIREAKTLDFSLQFPYELFEWKCGVNEYEVKSTDIIVVDSYKVNPKHLENIVRKFSHVVSIVDSRLNYPKLGIVLFASIYADKFDLKGGCTVLSGREYILFRKPFENRRMIVRENNSVKTIGITLGKTVSKHEILIVLQTVKEIFDNVVIKIIGSKIETCIDKVESYPFVDTEQYVTFIQSCDIVVVNGGQSLNECIVLGRPSISIEMADNQVMNQRAWGDLGTTLVVGRGLDGLIDTTIFKQHLIRMSDTDQRRIFANKCRELLDARGAERAVKRIIDGIKIN